MTFARFPNPLELLLPTRRKFFSASFDPATGMHIINQMALNSAVFTAAFWLNATFLASGRSVWASHTGQFQINTINTGDGLRARHYNNQNLSTQIDSVIGQWVHYTFTWGIDHFGTDDLRKFVDGVVTDSLSTGTTGSEITSVGSHWFMGDDSETEETDDGYRGIIFDFILLDGIFEPQRLNFNNGRWVDIDENVKRHLYYRLDGQDADPGRDSSGNGNHFRVENGGITLSSVDLPPGANEITPNLLRVIPGAVTTGVPLSNELISNMHFQRHYEPIAMGV